MGEWRNAIAELECYIHGVLAVTVAVAATVHSTVSKFRLLLTNICSFRLHTQH